MNVKNVFYGLFLCSFGSLAFASDEKPETFCFIEDPIEQQVNRLHYGEAPKQEQVSEQVPVKSVVVDLKDIQVTPKDPRELIVHSREEEFKSDEDKTTSPTSEQSESSNADSSSKPADQETASQDEPKGFSFLSIKEIAGQQLFALTAGAMVAGYCLYKVWDMFAAQVEQIQEELKISLTHQDREVLFALIQAMATDIQNLRENKHEASLVSQLDISSLSEVIAPECKAIISNFVELYNAIDLSGNNIEFIIMFYGEFERAVQALLMQAEII